MNIIQDSIQVMTQSPKVATVISWVTVMLGAFLSWLPENIGNIATVMGICLSSVLIYTHLKKYKREEEKHKLEIAILIKQVT